VGNFFSAALRQLRRILRSRLSNFAAHSDAFGTLGHPDVKGALHSLTTKQQAPCHHRRSALVGHNGNFDSGIAVRNPGKGRPNRLKCCETVSRMRQLEAQ
jgi:hypothetical protein